MFTKKDSSPVATDVGVQPPAPSKRSSSMKSKAPSILSADLVVHGSIMSEGEVQLDGTVEGDVRAGSLTIGEEANVKGEVVAETVVIRGRVQGSVRARQVQLASTARVEGDVIHATLSIESGAFFDGHCRRSTDPMTDKATARTGAMRSDAPASSGAPAAPKPDAQPQAQVSSFGKPAAPAAPPPSAANAPKV
jgi:cytoskeletal protein CcmA (bactofilin family)